MKNDTNKLQLCIIKYDNNHYHKKNPLDVTYYVIKCCLYKKKTHTCVSN